MKAPAILGAVVSITAASVANAKSNSMPQGHDPGAPINQGQYCRANTNLEGAGFRDHCDDSGQVICLRGIDTRTLSYGGGGGDGGGR